MTIVDFLRNIWRLVHPSLAYILPIATCLLFYLLKNKNIKIKKIIRVAIILVFFYVSYGFIFAIIQIFKHPIVWDFTAFYLYGKVAVSGHNFYLPENFQNVFYSLHLPALDYSEFIRESVNVGFFYPPPTIFLFAPLGFFSYNTALFCWIIFNLLFALGSIYLIYDLFFKSYKLYGLLFVTILFFLFPPVIWTISFSQTNFILLFLLLLMKKYSDKKFAGIFLALAFFVKPYMIIFGLIFLLKKQWKTIAYFILTSLILCGITILTFGFTPFLSYLYNNAAKRLPAEAFSENINQSLQAVLLRHHIITLDNPIVYVIIAIGVFLLTGVYLLYLVRKKLYEYIWAILLLIVLIIYPGTLSHYGVMLLFIIFQFFENSQIKFKWYFSTLLIGVIYYLNPISLFTSLCMLLIIFILQSFLNPNFKKMVNETI